MPGLCRTESCCDWSWGGDVCMVILCLNVHYSFWAYICTYIFQCIYFNDFSTYMWKNIIDRTNWLENKTQLKDSKENWKWILTPRNSFCLDWMKLYTGTVCTGTNVGSEVYYNCISVLLQDLYIYTTVLQKLEKNRYFGTVYSHGTHRSLDSSSIYLNLIFFFLADQADVPLKSFLTWVKFSVEFHEF